MRIWSLHPKYLDARGLVALWREALLAKKVIEGKTKGYQHHPQLTRFRDVPHPVAAINAYLQEVYREACRRGYHFDRNKIGVPLAGEEKIPVTSGQLIYEWNHLQRKLQTRSQVKFAELQSLTPGQIEPHPLLYVIPGALEKWEKILLP